MWQKTPCPSSLDLKRLIDGTLPPGEQKTIDRHLWFCGTCQTQLESLAYDEDGSPRSIACPELAVLKHHLEGTVSAYAQEAIENHLESCSSCQAVFEAIASGEVPEPALTECPDTPFWLACFTARSASRNGRQSSTISNLARLARRPSMLLPAVMSHGHESSEA